MKTYATTLTCSLPVRLQRGGQWWEIRVEADGKSGECLTAKRLDDDAVFAICRGRRGSISVCDLPSKPGTIRHELFLILSASGRAEMKEFQDKNRAF